MVMRRGVGALGGDSISRSSCSNSEPSSVELLDLTRTFKIDPFSDPPGSSSTISNPVSSDHSEESAPSSVEYVITIVLYLCDEP